ncbi:hypothetical protein MICRO11B_340009 [Micrococcus luteus]|nr:hypothetical protein MICRO11B_340009 [Micrococcus luteus]
MFIAPSRRQAGYTPLHTPRPYEIITSEWVQFGPVGHI